MLALIDLLVDVVRRLRRQNARLRALGRRTEEIVAALDKITEAIAADRAVTQAEHDEVAAALAAVSAQIVELQARVDELVAGQVTQEEIDAVAADVTDLGTAVADIYTPEAPPAEA